MSEQKQLPQYKCHKVVGALKIRAIEKGVGDWADLYFEDEGFYSTPIRVSKEWMASRNPEYRLGYYVQYGNGHTSWSPSDAFESGYTRILDVQPQPIDAVIPQRPAIDISRYVGQLSPEADAVIDDMFDYHAWDDDQKARGALVRQALAAAFKTIVVNVPPSHDRSAALRKIRDARMDCNSAISHRGKY